MNTFKVDDFVWWEGKVYRVLGFAASRDLNDVPLVEIAWSNTSLSPTGYLAVPEMELSQAYRWDAALEYYPNIKKLGLTIHDYNSTWMVSADRLEEILKEKLK